MVDEAETGWWLIEKPTGRVTMGREALGLQVVVKMGVTLGMIE
jgi:hypothetical protein